MPRIYSIDFGSSFLASAMNSCNVCGQAFPSSKNSWGVTPRYNREGNDSDCTQQSLLEQFADKDGTTIKAEAKAHLTKFLDVTRSDMLFSDKVILVEGIAEKLLVPLFMEICGCPYEDEHISIVEIGGKHFQYFVELFNGNAIKKKVLCITDKDFKWIDFDGDGNLRSYSE